MQEEPLYSEESRPWLAKFSRLLKWKEERHQTEAHVFDKFLANFILSTQRKGSKEYEQTTFRNINSSTGRNFKDHKYSYKIVGNKNLTPTRNDLNKGP